MEGWEGADAVLANMDKLDETIMRALEGVANYFELLFEQYAKENARWKDRTANARQSLHSWNEVAGEVVELYLAHGMEYGVYLETRWSGRYAILWETVQAHFTQITEMLEEIFS